MADCPKCEKIRELAETWERYDYHPPDRNISISVCQINNCGTKILAILDAPDPVVKKDSEQFIQIKNFVQRGVNAQQEIDGIIKKHKT